MHVAAMQDVMLGELGGTVKLTQAEDMSWWLGETAVADGSVHTHENGNMYTLMMDAEGMWSAMYKKVEVIVQLGTQGPITLERAEDMSWWLGSEAVDVGSEVMSDSGNTYTLWYTDGVWSTRFEPESMMIEGTGLVAMTKEDRSGYTVDGADLLGPLPALGTDIDTSMGSYRVTMSDGKLMGTRLDNVAIDWDTADGIGDFEKVRDHTGASRWVLIRRDEDDTEDVNEALTALTVGGQDKHYTFDDLLGDGVSQTEGENFVAKAREDLEGIRDQIAAILDALDDSDQPDQVARLWGDDVGNRRSTSVNGVLNKVFGVEGISSEPNPDDALEEIGKLITALSSVDGLESALDLDGVFEDVNVKGRTAEQIFAVTDEEATVTYGMVGKTRFGTISRKTRADALQKDAKYTYDAGGSDGSLGAFAFGVGPETQRYRYIATQGNALYEGKTLAVDQDGMNYSGDINIRVRFNTEEVDGLITNLESTDGPWTYFFDDVESIVLPTGKLAPAGTWEENSTTASLTFSRRAGSTRDIPIPGAKFSGRLLGGNTAPDAGNEAVGVWSIGSNPGSSTYLAGGFGAERTVDEPDRRPGGGDFTGTDTKLLAAGQTNNDTSSPPSPDGVLNSNSSKTALGSGQLKVTMPKFAWERSEGALDTNSTWTWRRADTDNPRTEDDEEMNNATRTFTVDLTALADKAGGVYNQKGATFVTIAKGMIESERGKLAALINLGDDFVPQAKERWQAIQEILLTHVFNTAGARSGTTAFSGLLPEKVSGEYEDLRNPLGTVDDIIEALSSSDNFEGALDPDEDGLFVVDNPDGTRMGFGTTAGKTWTKLWGQVESQMWATFGSTDYTRFGVWRVRDGSSAQNLWRNWNTSTVETFAYSPLPKVEVDTVNSPAFPDGETATYTGRTVAFLNNNSGYEGDVSVTVKWGNLSNTVGGSVMTVVSNLTSMGNGDHLYHNGQPVRELVFPDYDFETNPATDDHVLDYESTALGVTVWYMNRTSAEQLASRHDGIFVGSTSDGPLAVMGRYGFADNSGFFPSETIPDNDSDGQALNGAFGADLP